MGEIINLCNSNSQELIPVDNDIIEITDNILFDARASITHKQVISMPIAELATLGMGFASLIPAFNTVTQTTTVTGEGLYRLVNAGVGDVLKVAKNGELWGALKTADGASKMARFEAASEVAATTTTAAAINPAILMLAIALFSIEQQLSSIDNTCKQVRSFLEREKESEIESDLETLSDSISKYKDIWDNDREMNNRHMQALDIQTRSRKHINSYKKEVTEIINTKKLLVLHNKVSDTLNELLRKFNYYRLSLYTFSMASFVEIILSGDYKEDLISKVRTEIEDMSMTYRELFGQCSIFLEKLSDSSVETNLLKGIGTASNAVGKFIEHIPVIKEGPVDEFLQGSGTQMKKAAADTERKVVESFAAISNPGVSVFVDKLNDMIQIYGHTEEIYFDNKQSYLVAG